MDCPFAFEQPAGTARDFFNQESTASSWPNGPRAVQLACHEAGAAVRIIISDGLMTQVGRAPPALWRRLYLGWGITQIPDGIFIFSCTESWVSRCASHCRRRHISFFSFLRSLVRGPRPYYEVRTPATHHARAVFLEDFPRLKRPTSGGARRAAAHAARPYRARSRQAAQLVARPRPAARLTPRKSPAPTPSSPFLADAPMDGARGCSTTPTGRHKNYALDLAIVALP